ncbi:MAG: P-loop NTPase [Pirellulaceae bacterium]|nr:P-loop NTPase [Pirellulaceae bacterium]
MQNSLNQAFIRAYAKERDAVHAQAVNSAADSQAAIQRANEELILRIDTTSVEIPRPHLTSRPSIKQNAPTVAMAGAASAPTHERATRTAEDELRASIASEMLRAGGWQSEEIASLGPIASVASPVASAPVASAPVAPEYSHQTGYSPVASAPMASIPFASEPSSPVVTKPMVATIAEDAEPRSNALDRDAELLDTGTARFFSREAVRQSPNESGHRPGSILRLDKALGAPPTPEQPKPVAKAAPQVLPKPVEEVAAPQVEPPPVKQPAVAKPAMEAVASTSNRSEAVAQAKYVEKELRRAKVRVFNPIWEVDQLQWPEVCIKLMDARMDSLSHVTKHLSEACQEGLQVLAVTSPEGGEGRTTVACCLAMLAGNRGLKVAIVDGDIENPTLSLQTNLEIENDWQSAIVNHLPLEEVSVHSIDDQITLVPLLGPLDQTELPGSDQRIADMLIELTESFDLVILDIGHMNSPNGLMSTLAEQGIINAAIAVVDNRNPSIQRTETCIRRIRQAGVSSIGIVENFASSSQ